MYGLAGRSEGGGVGGALSLGSLASLSSLICPLGVLDGSESSSESSSSQFRSGSSSERRSTGGRGWFEAVIEAASLSRSLWPTDGRLGERKVEPPLRRWDGNADFGCGGDGGESIDF